VYEQATTTATALWLAKANVVLLLGLMKVAIALMIILRHAFRLNFGNIT
jgi:hypothetical protein